MTKFVHDQIKTSDQAVTELVKAIERRQIVTFCPAFAGAERGYERPIGARCGTSDRRNYPTRQRYIGERRRRELTGDVRD